MIKRVCVFCGSSQGARPAYAKAAAALAQSLVARGLTIVYGGGNVGLMGVLADTARAAGGKVIGVIPHSLVAKEVAHTELPDLRIVDSMHERKALMADLADAFIAMPGGYGTFEEFCEILSWTQLGLQLKPCGILNIEGYYNHLLQMFDHAALPRRLSFRYCEASAERFSIRIMDPRSIILKNLFASFANLYSIAIPFTILSAWALVKLPVIIADAPSDARTTGAITTCPSSRIATGLPMWLSVAARIFSAPDALNSTPMLYCPGPPSTSRAAAMSLLVTTAAP